MGHNRGNRTISLVIWLINYMMGRSSQYCIHRKPLHSFSRNVTFSFSGKKTTKPDKGKKAMDALGPSSGCCYWRSWGSHWWIWKPEKWLYENPDAPNKRKKQLKAKVISTARGYLGINIMQKVFGIRGMAPCLGKSIHIWSIIRFYLPNYPRRPTWSIFQKSINYLRGRETFADEIVRIYSAGPLDTSNSWMKETPLAKRKISIQNQSWMQPDKRALDSGKSSENCEVVEIVEIFKRMWLLSIHSKPSFFT